jgi:hypothetical protein
MNLVAHQTKPLQAGPTHATQPRKQARGMPYISQFSAHCKANI